MQDFLTCLNYMSEKHKGQKRIGGAEYDTHPTSVALILRSKGFDEETIMTGLFHDLLEDTDATYEEIVSLSNEDVAKAVKELTKENGYKIEEYIQRINNNPRAKAVKLADRYHNLLCAVHAPRKFRKKYIKETEMYYLKLASGTIFEQDINKALKDLRSVK